MARKKKKNSHVYWICMGIYAVVLIAAVAVPLFTSLPAFVGVIAFVCLVGIWELAGAFARMGITLTVTPL